MIELKALEKECYRLVSTTKDNFIIRVSFNNVDLKDETEKMLIDHGYKKEPRTYTTQFYYEEE